MKHREIVAAVEAVAPLSCQEEWDNSGFQVGHPEGEATGALLCVDVTPEILREALKLGCSLVIAHHPLLFHATRNLLGRDRTERCVELALANGLTIYASHTACDCAPATGVSWEMARQFGLEDVETLDTASGLGCVGNLPAALNFEQLVAQVKATFGTPVVKASRTPEPPEGYRRIALCGGAAAEFAPQAAACGAQAYITADCKLNTFLDTRDDILLLDAGHFDTEQCTKEIFYRAISQKFPNFALYKSSVEQNPIRYL